MSKNPEKPNKKDRKYEKKDRDYHPFKEDLTISLDPMDLFKGYIARLNKE